MFRGQLFLSIFLLWGFCTGYYIEGRPEFHNLSYNTQQAFESVFTNDEFFQDAIPLKVIGSGSYGTVITMRKKIGDEEFIFAVKMEKDSMISPHPSKFIEKDLQMSENSVSGLFRNLRVVDYLTNKGNPFMPKVYSSRYLMLENIKIDKQTPLPYQALATYNLQIMEYGEYGSLVHFAKFAKESGLDTVALFTDIFRKLLLAISRFYEDKVIHGDIKPQNIFVKSCNVGQFKYCPIVGDWDLGYFMGEGAFAEDQLRYTARYRPIEQHFYKRDNSHLFIGPGGYTYSGLEDTYALGMTMVMIGLELGLNFHDHQPLINIIEGMVYPLSFDEAGSIIVNGNLDHVIYYTHLNQYRAPKINDPNFQQFSIRKICSKVVERFNQYSTISQNKAYMNEVKTLEKSFMALENDLMMSDLKSFWLVENFIKSKQNIPLWTQSEFSEFEFYMNYKRSLSKHNNFPNLLERRSKPQDALNAVTELMFPGKDEVELSYENTNLLVEALREESHRIKVHDENNGGVIVLETGYKYIVTLKNMCAFIFNKMGVKTVDKALEIKAQKAVSEATLYIGDVTAFCKAILRPIPVRKLIL